MMEISEKTSLLGNSVTEDTIMKSDGDDDSSKGTSKDMNRNKRGGQVEEVAELAKPNLKMQPSPTQMDRADHHQSKQKQEADDDIDELESAKAEMKGVREENERLKVLLARIVKDYKDLQKHFLDVIQNEETEKKSNMDTSSTTIAAADHQEAADELVSLSLGRTLSTAGTTSNYDRHRDSMMKKTGRDNDDDEAMINEAGLALELGCRSFEPDSGTGTGTIKQVNSSSENDSSAAGGPIKELDEVTEVWPPSKMLKTRDNDISQQQTHLKKARVSVRVRCDAPTLNDGCQWRKYGQKIAKGNPCPRAYYRCTVSPSCPVRKQVQRCAEDMSILITTYEGNHNHPLPMSATAMASTTSAAASMLQSHSSTSQQGLVNSTSTAPVSTSTNEPHNHGLNFTSQQRLEPQLTSQFYFPNSSISTNNSHPTITLDLTAPSPSHFGLRFPPSSRYSSSLNFSSSSSSSSLDYNTLLQAPNWSNNHHATAAGYFNNGTTAHNRMNQVVGTGKQPPFHQDPNFYQSYIQNSQKATPASSPQHPLFTETIATATKAITSDPKFQSALAAALTSLVGANGGTSGGGAGRENGHLVNGSSSSTTESSDLKLKWGESSLTPNNPVGYPSSSAYLNKSS